MKTSPRDGVCQKHLIVQDSVNRPSIRVSTNISHDGTIRVYTVKSLSTPHSLFTNIAPAASLRFPAIFFGDFA